MKLNLKILDDSFSIHRFSPNNEIPAQIYKTQFYSITKTDEELSVVQGILRSPVLGYFFPFVARLEECIDCCAA